MKKQDSVTGEQAFREHEYGERERKRERERERVRERERKEEPRLGVTGGQASS
jgi:hypothetical protein